MAGRLLLQDTPVWPEGLEDGFGVLLPPKLGLGVRGLRV